MIVDENCEEVCQVGVKMSKRRYSRRDPIRFNHAFQKLLSKELSGVNLKRSQIYASEERFIVVELLSALLNIGIHFFPQPPGLWILELTTLFIGQLPTGGRAV